MEYQCGTFYELMIFMLAPVHTYTGYYPGSTWGFGWTGGIAGVFIGVPIIFKLVFSVGYLGTGMLAAIGLGVSFFIPQPWKLYWLISLSCLPVIRRYDLLLRKDNSVELEGD